MRQKLIFCQNCLYSHFSLSCTISFSNFRRSFAQCVTYTQDWSRPSFHSHFKIPVGQRNWKVRCLMRKSEFCHSRFLSKVDTQLLNNLLPCPGLPEKFPKYNSFPSIRLVFAITATCANGEKTNHTRKICSQFRKRDITAPKKKIEITNTERTIIEK